MVKKARCLAHASDPPHSLTRATSLFSSILVPPPPLVDREEALHVAFQVPVLEELGLIFDGDDVASRGPSGVAPVRDGPRVLVGVSVCEPLRIVDTSRSRRRSKTGIRGRRLSNSLRIRLSFSLRMGTASVTVRRGRRGGVAGRRHWTDRDRRPSHGLPVSLKPLLRANFPRWDRKSPGPEI